MTTISMHSSPTFSAPKLRLTRRGRIVIGGLVVVPLAAIALAAALNGGAASASSSDAGLSYDYVTIEGGQSLWDLAEKMAPTADPREVIADFVHLNNLASSEVLPGQKLAVPDQYEN